MRDRDLIIDALEEAQRVLTEHFEHGSIRHPSTTIHRLLMVLDRPDLKAAVRRLKADRGLRTIK